MKYEIGARIKSARERKGLQQKQAAEILGISAQKLANWEKGTNRPNAEMLPKICKAFDVSLDTLLDTQKTEHSTLSFDAIRIARAYDMMTDKGRAAVDAVVELAISTNS